VEDQGQAVLEQGTRLGKYEIIRLIGVGSMGAVYEGVRVGTGKRFAIKVLRPALAAVAWARGRLL
jgi:serine/threonine protein kinase